MSARFDQPSPMAGDFVIEQQKINEKLKEVAMKVQEAKALWLDRQFLNILPQHVYQWGHGDVDQQRRAAEWIKEKGFYYEESPTCIRLMQKEEGKEAKRISEFRFKFDTQKPIQ